MKLKLILYFCLTTITDACFIKRIFGGRDAKQNEFPNIVTIHGRQSYSIRIVMFSTGVIVNEKWIPVTTKCVSLIQTTYSREYIKAYAGKINLTEDSPNVQIRGIKKVISHVQSLKDKSAVVAGWVSSNLDELANGVASNTLKVTNVEIIDYNDCKAAAKKIIESNRKKFKETDFDRFHFCTGSFNTMEGLSAGDLGGPVMQFNEFFSDYDVVALISVENTVSGLPSVMVYTRIPPYYSWIYANTLI